MKMKLIMKKQVILTFIILLFSTIAWGQRGEQPLTGGGTQYDPYLIRNDADWEAFAAYVNDDSFDENYRGKYIRLERDIDVTTIVGTKSETTFKGNFDGNWHTLKVEINSLESDNSLIAAPFGNVEDGVTISNLRVVGHITTTGDSNKDPEAYTGGIAARVYYNVNFENCTSEVIITIKTKATSYAGGLVGYHVQSDDSQHLSFTNCAFEGNISDGAGLSGSRIKYAGFVAQLADERAARYSNCAMAGAITTTLASTATYSFGSSLSLDGTNYYVRDYGNADGLARPDTDEPTTYIGKRYNIDNRTYYIPVQTNIADFASGVMYCGVNVIVNYYGTKLVKDTDYRVTTTASSITIDSEGEKKFFGRVTKSGLDIKTINDWADLQKYLGESNKSKNRVLTLDKDFVDENNDGALDVFCDNGKSVTLNLNGYTIDRGLFDKVNPVANYTGFVRGYVMLVKSRVLMTINGPGTIKGGNNQGTQGTSNLDGNGGGIVNYGVLTLNNVTISRNKTLSSKDANTGATYWGTGGGIYTTGTLNMNGGVLENNVSYGGGGGIHSYKSTTIMNGVCIRNNIANSKGGGIRSEVKDNVGRVDMYDCLITDNIVNKKDASDGGGIYNSGNHTYTRCKILNNNASYRGGGAFVMGGIATFTDCLIDNNTSLGQSNDAFTGGGGVFIYGGTCNLYGTTVTGNTSYTVGGVIVNSIIVIVNGNPTPVVGKLNVKGKVIVDHNIGDAPKQNIYLGSDRYIQVVGNLDAAARMGVSKQVAKGVKDLVVTTGLAYNDRPHYQGKKANFHSDNYKMYWLLKNDESGSETNVSLKESLRWSNPDAWEGYVQYEDGELLDVKAPLIMDYYVDKETKAVKIANVANIKMATDAAIFIDESKSGNVLQHGQLIYTGEEPVKISVIKQIEKASKGERDDEAAVYGWYTIASPVNTPKLTENTNLITSKTSPYNFDLLRYEEKEARWYNYLIHSNDFTTMENGRGYIYRNAENLTVEYTGDINVGNITYAVTCESSQAGLKGWNLIGNPYTFDITLQNTTLVDAGGNQVKEQGNPVNITAAYILDKDGDWEANVVTTINVAQGFLVKIPDGLGVHGVKFSIEPRSKERYNNEFIQFNVSNNLYDDVTYALFEEGYGLPKINHRNPDIPMVYIHQEDDDYAVATMGDETKAFNLNFKAMTAGQYTLSYKTEGEFNYLHVIDCFTGRDIDMLNEEEYSFIASPKDKDSRFIVRLQYKPNYSSDGNDIFAYQNGSDILVSGDGELQVYDAMGRFVMSKRINGAETINLNATGVYIFKLIGEEIHTQKIVVR